MMIIYKMTNKVNGKVYIGQTQKSLKKRITDHFNDCGRSYIKNALRKHGRDSFDIEIIDTATSKAELNEKEIFWIKQYDCRVPKGYNICIGGEGANGYKHSKEAILSMSVRFKGKKQSEELIKKRADGVKRFWSNPENKKRMIEAMNGSQTEEGKKRISEKKKEYWSNPENKKELSERMKAFWSDPERRKKQSETVRLTKLQRKAA